MTALVTTEPTVWPNSLHASATPTAFPKDQIELITRTVAKDATHDELALFLYDCQRRGVHPLDKLLHFTKRGGRYTPVTSIDFMRSQAAMSGEMAGSDDPLFSRPGPADDGFAATVTVYRITQGQRFAYTATARWTEYCPTAGQDHMWKRMPHTMLGKCAEALALRKAFPQQLAGLYSREEMDQADGPKAGYTVEAPVTKAQAAVAKPVTLPAGESASRPSGAEVLEGAAFPSDSNLPPGALYIERVDRTPVNGKPHLTRCVVTFSTGEQASTIKEQLGSLCEQLCQERIPVTVDCKATKWGMDLVAVHRIPAVELAPLALVATGPELTDDDIPF